MSISPPSDLILDVVRAADPVRQQQATARLNRMAGPAEAAFETIFDQNRNSGRPAASTVAAEPHAAASAQPARKAAEAFQAFEAMTLATMIEASLPEEGSTVFGSGTAGGMWKSMLAQEIATEMAKAGGIGIAEQLAASAQFRAGDDEPAASQHADATRSLLTAQLDRAFVDSLRADETNS